MIRHHSGPRSAALEQKIKDGSAIAGVVGLGYVGLPLLVQVARSGYRSLGLDVNAGLVKELQAGRSHIQDVDSRELSRLLSAGVISVTADLSRLAECDVVSVCVPTPLNKIRDPDLSFVMASARAVRSTLRPGQLVILESTTYPGTTREVVLPVLEESGLQVGEDFFLCFSPERVDPGNPVWNTKNTPKVLGGITSTCRHVATELYTRIFDTVVPVSNAEAAELVKVYENTFRMINIALANELAQACDRLDLDVWEVIDAAATKPFGFMKFTPGPGLGGHCIPLDPHYLAWKMRTLAFKTRMIDLASEINGEMPGFVVQKVMEALNGDRKPLNGSRVLILGVAYKKDIADLRESPALEIMGLLQEKGAEVRYHDPFCEVIPEDGVGRLRGLPIAGVSLTNQELSRADVVVVITDHASIDYRRVGELASLVVDTRGVMRNHRPHVARVVGLSGDLESSQPAAVVSHAS